MKYEIGDKVKIIITHSRIVAHYKELEKIIKDEIVVTISDYNKDKNDYAVEELEDFWFPEKSLKLVKRYKLRKSLLLSNSRNRFDILDIR